MADRSNGSIEAAAENDHEMEKELFQAKTASGTKFSYFLYGSVANAESKNDDKEKQQEGRNGRNNEIVESVMEHAAPVLHFAITTAKELQAIFAETTNVAAKLACRQIGDLQDTSVTHYYYAKDTYRRWKRDFQVSEDAFFSDLKDVVKKASNKPDTAASIAAAAALILAKRPRRFLFRHTLGRFRSPDAMFARAENKVKEMRLTFDQQKSESKKLEERFRLAEEELLRGRSKMSNAGKLLCGLSRTILKTEKQANGLVEKIEELPRKDGLRLKSEVKIMVDVARQQRRALERDLEKIANYYIS